MVCHRRAIGVLSCFTTLKSRNCPPLSLRLRVTALGKSKIRHCTNSVSNSHQILPDFAANDDV